MNWTEITNWTESTNTTNEFVYFMQSGAYPPTAIYSGGTTGMRAIEERRQIKSSGWHRCPFCNMRQDVKKDGPDCKHCGGDILGGES